MAARRRPAPRAPNLRRATAVRSSSAWSRVDRFTRRRIVAKTEEAEFALLRIGVGHEPSFHSHGEPQVGVVISGSGVHRLLLSVRRGRRTVKQITEMVLKPGDCYFIPRDVPHEFQIEGGRPVVALDVTLAKPRRRASRSG